MKIIFCCPKIPLFNIESVRNYEVWSYLEDGLIHCLVSMASQCHLPSSFLLCFCIGHRGLSSTKPNKVKSIKLYSHVFDKMFSALL